MRVWLHRPGLAHHPSWRARRCENVCLVVPASEYLPSANSTTIAASSIQGTGAQNLSKDMRIGALVSGIALGPDFSSRRRASSVVKPPFETTSGALAVAVDGHVRPRLPWNDYSAALTSGDDDAPGWSYVKMSHDQEFILRGVPEIASIEP